MPFSDNRNQKSVSSRRTDINLEAPSESNGEQIMSVKLATRLYFENVRSILFLGRPRVSQVFEETITRMTPHASRFPGSVGRCLTVSVKFHFSSRNSSVYQYKGYFSNIYYTSPLQNIPVELSFDGVVIISISKL